MGDYFKPMRRKIGILTLVMACVFAGVWVRSEMIYDDFHLELPIDRRHTLAIESMFGRIEVAATFYNTQRRRSPPAHFATQTITFNENEGDFEFSNCWLPTIKGVWGRLDEVDSWSGYIVVLPYWSITVPLTLLSAYLLLSKPRKSTPKKLFEPIAAEGA
jgi:hypothetical protein